MAYFKDYTSPSSKSRYLIIATKGTELETKLLVQTPLVGRYADTWPHLKNTLYMADWTFQYNHKSNKASKVWCLEMPNLRFTNIASVLPCLGRRMIQGELRWGGNITFEGEYHFISGYWEWTEDVLSRCDHSLRNAKIYDAVFASLFTYDRNSNIVQAFCEAWCPKTNTLLTSLGELSISLWDLHILGGLPIGGFPYEEVVPDAVELTGVDEKKERFIPRTCEYLFAAFHHLREGKGNNPQVPFSEWIRYWCKKDIKYNSAPERKEKKTRRPSLTHNPTGKIAEAVQWSNTEEAIFSELGVRHLKNETYLAAYLSCWLCAFVFPSGEGDFIRPGTFKMASMMASGRKISLAVPVLASIYNGLNKISHASQLDEIKVCFPIHYVYSWLAHYFRTHYPLPGQTYNPRMVTYSGEGAAKYFNKQEARMRIHRGESAVWSVFMLDRPHPTHFVDDSSAPELESNYFMSLRFNYVPLRNGDNFTIEPYSPHRFCRQFGFQQCIPGYLDKDLRDTPLDEGLRFWRICISRNTLSKATFPSVASAIKKLHSTDYASWWEKVHGKFLEDRLEALVDISGPEFSTHFAGKTQNIDTTPLKVDNVVVSNPKVVVQRQREKTQPTKVIAKKVVYASTSKAAEKCLQVSQSGKRVSQDTSRSSDEDCNWKRKRHSVDVKVVEAQSVDSSSRTLTASKGKRHIVKQAMVSLNEKQVSDESITGSVSKAKSSSATYCEQETSSVPKDKGLAKSSFTLKETPQKILVQNEDVSIFNGRDFIFNSKMSFISNLWTTACAKLSNTSLDSISSREEQVKSALEVMEKMGIVDLSPLKGLVKSFFELAASYDQDRSNMADKRSEEEKLKLLSNAKERLQSFKLEESEQLEQVSYSQEAVKKIEVRLEKLQNLKEEHEAAIEAGQKEAEEIRTKIQAVKDEISSYDDVDVLKAEDSSNLEEKKGFLKAVREELMNYKLCFD